MNDLRAKVELKRRVLDKLLEVFIGLVREIDEMDEIDLEQMNKDLLYALHKEKTVGIPGRTYRNY